MSFAVWAMLVAGFFGALHSKNYQEVRAAERETGMRCAIVWETSRATDVAPFLHDGEVLRRPLYWFGGHQIACVPRGAGDKTRLQQIRHDTDEAYMHDMCVASRGYYFRSRCVVAQEHKN
jgi:hypothetical protein